MRDAPGIRRARFSRNGGQPDLCKVLELAELRYRGGVAAYLEVLDAQRSLFVAELSEAQTVGSHLVSLVRLYKALGGGWPTAPEPAAETRTP